MAFAEGSAVRLRSTPTPQQVIFTVGVILWGKTYFPQSAFATLLQRTSMQSWIAGLLLMVLNSAGQRLDASWSADPCLSRLIGQGPDSMPLSAVQIHR